MALLTARTRRGSCGSAVRELGSIRRTGIACAWLFALVSFALAGGCTQTVWEHRAFSTPPTAAEIGECRRSAYSDAQHRAFFYAFARQRSYLDQSGRLIYDSWLPFGYYDPSVLERDLFRYCLEGKGYRAVPARPADRAMDG
jgi:hypothetical protein